MIIITSREEQNGERAETDNHWSALHDALKNWKKRYATY
jgi:hypothetical protein